MRNSLIFKLMGTFLLVIAIGALVISILVSRATQNAFSIYTTRSGQVWAQRLAPVLADYYAQNGSWQNVNGVLQDGLVSIDPSGMMMGNGQGPGRGLGFRAGAGMMGQRLILVDRQGIVVGDTQNEWIGKQISPSEMKNGEQVTVNNDQVGTLLVTPNNIAGAGTPAGEFLVSVKQSIVTSVVFAGIIAMILGAVLFFQITAPLRELKKAAVSIAHGDLNQRVAIHSHDELGELGQAFNHMAESLADAEMQRQHLVADVAHELRTPLAAIQATLEGMQDGVLPLDDEQVAALHSETMLLNRLVGDLRLLSLAEAGQLKLELSDTDLGDLIQQVVDRIKSQANQKNITLETNIPDHLPGIKVDSDRITQVLNNLIGNALRYTPEGGTITIWAELLAGIPQSIQVSVTDSGPGIDSEALPRVFDRFYRGDKSRTRASGGSGLGLAIVKQLVETHGGVVEAASPVFQSGDQPAYGTQISFRLPLPPSPGKA